MLRVENEREVRADGKAVLDFQCSTMSDLPVLNQPVPSCTRYKTAAGSIAQVIQTGAWYTLDANGSWYFSGGGDAPTPVLITKIVTANGTYTASSDNAEGYSSVTVDVDGGEATLTTKSITVNGTYAASGDNADGYSSVTVAVENSYTAQDEGKVVSSGALVAQSTHKQISANGTGIDTTNYSSVDVEVPNSYSDVDEGKVVSSGTLVSQTTDSTATNGIVDTTTISSLTVNVPNTYAAGDEGKVVSNGALVAQTSVEKTVNGTYDTTTNNSVVVNVANSYSAADEGKVVSNGELVAQGSDSVTTNGTVDTTLISSLLVNVSGGSGGLSQVAHLTTNDTAISENELYLAESETYFFVFGCFTSSKTGSVVFLIPNDFDETKISSYISGASIRIDTTSTTAGDVSMSHSSSTITVNVPKKARVIYIGAFSKLT